MSGQAVPTQGSSFAPLSAPSFLRELSDEAVVLGQSVTLACQVLAQPTAQATWSKGKELSWSLCAGLVRTSSNHRPSRMLWLSWGKAKMVLSCHRWSPPGEQRPPPYLFHPEELPAVDHPGGDRRGPGHIYVLCEQSTGDSSHHRCPAESRYVVRTGSLYQGMRAGLGVPGHLILLSEQDKASYLRVHGTWGLQGTQEKSKK